MARRRLRRITKSVMYQPIGIIRTPFRSPRGTPIQPAAGKGVRGTVEVFPDYADGLRDLDGFSHIVLIYHFHLVRGHSLRVMPFMDCRRRGIFATRAPRRPNPIGLSVVRLDRIDGNILYIRDVDIVDGTPLIDIKPYVREFESIKRPRLGWLGPRITRLGRTRDDGRFVK
jgi:tRNA-Thr(GGU) m(6)t(6)A37 methyltransferase TsaA